MKHTKIIVALVLAGVFAFAPATIAADKKEKKKPEAGAKAKGKRPANPLLSLSGLTDEQKTQLKELMKEFGAKRKEAGKDRDKQRELFKAQTEKLKEILSEEQLKELNEKRAAMRKGKGGKGAKGGAKGKGKGKKKSDK